MENKNKLDELVGINDWEIFVQYIKENKFEEFTIQIHNFLLEEIEQINNMQSQLLKQKRIGEIKEIIKSIKKSQNSNNSEFYKNIEEKIQDIVDLSLEWIIDTAVELTIIENWEPKEWYEQNPFYSNWNNIKFHRKWNVLDIDELDTIVIKDIENAYEIANTMNEKYNAWKQKTKKYNVTKAQNSTEIMNKLEENYDLMKIEVQEKYKIELNNNKTSNSDELNDTNIESNNDTIEIIPENNNTLIDENIELQTKGSTNYSWYYSEIFEQEWTIFKWTWFTLNEEIEDNSQTEHNEYNWELLARLEQNSSSDFAMKKHLWSIASNAEFSLNFLHITQELEKALEGVYAWELQSDSWKQAIIRYKKFEKEWEKIFGKKGLPKHTSLIAYNESKIKYWARSYAWAVGYFQFISQTGKTYSLKSDKFVDERMDPIKSANAAAKYVADLRDMWYEIQTSSNYKDAVIKEEMITIWNNNLEEISKKYNLNTILKYNDLSINELVEWVEIRMPIEYNLDKETKEKVKKDSLYLALSSYNGGLATKLKWVTSYEKFVQNMSELIKQTKIYSNSLSWIIKNIKENSNINMDQTIDNVINIFSNISNKFFKIDFFEQTIKSLQEIKKSKGNIGTKKKQLLNIIDWWENYGNYLEYWYYEILAQNLFYPAKLFAVKKAYKNSEISKIENNQNLIHNPVNLNNLASKHGTDLNWLTFIKLSKSLWLKPQELYEYNHHIISPRWNILENKDFRINIPNNLQWKLENIIKENLWKKENNDSSFAISIPKIENIGNKLPTKKFIEIDTPETIDYSNPKWIGFNYLRNKWDYKVFSYISNTKISKESVANTFNKLSVFNEMINPNKDIVDKNFNPINNKTIWAWVEVYILAKKKK